MIKPPKLQPGDTVAAVSLSWGGPGALPHRYQAGKRQLEETFGLQVIEMPHALAEPEWVAKNPQARAEDLMNAFYDPSIKAVIATIGGEDSIRLLPWIDLEGIRQHPKAFLGFSDSTVTHLACYNAGLVSFYGPAIMAGFAENGGMFAYMVDSLLRTLFTSAPPGLISPSQEGWTVERLDWSIPDNQNRRRKRNPPLPWRFVQGEKTVQGRLIGGCLEVLDWLRGTPVWPPAEAWREAILFLETSEEAPSPLYVERALRSLAAMNVLSELSGILFGRPGGGVNIHEFIRYEEAILGVIRDELGHDDLPVVTCMDFGHTDPVFVLPYGVLAQIDPQQKQFSILESAVVEIPD
jgi:muramoyltetrapeptide carboxypeptidase LdcA involved in peptidoglycan recycling